MTANTIVRKRYLTRKMARQIRHLYFEKHARGALEDGVREVPDPTALGEYKRSCDCNEWPIDSDLTDGPFDIRDGVGRIELSEGLCLDLYVYLPTESYETKRDDWSLWENICVRFNGTEWERAEYPEQRAPRMA